MFAIITKTVYGNFKTEGESRVFYENAEFLPKILNSKRVEAGGMEGLKKLTESIKQDNEKNLAIARGIFKQDGTQAHVNLKYLTGGTNL